ncbi:hypothetical protein K227x_49200 [Rubripirellula lacrimiformis]|uniref:Transmembrane protein n=1 Tax=Rubripirellula lacrimiformis TaxID=1930273 RepID=A0A517NH90_9BACT|nr:hypothetical protein K227x_49200 [Rubripirellula lacrimiformis]
MRHLIALILFVALVSPPVFHLAGAQDRAKPSSVDSGRGDLGGSDVGLSDVGLGDVDIQDPSLDRADVETDTEVLSAESIQRNLEGPIDAGDIAAASGWATNSGVVDWLGPLAPVALSPFFGVTCLSGLALWGPDWATDNAVLGVAGPLRNEWLFVIFMGLTLLTSLPRLTKVSKPFAQAVDRLETYAVIVILLVIKLVMSAQNPGDGELGGTPVAMVHLGIVSMTLDTLLAVAMVINILVINSVKFFFEFLVWLTPVPFLDAVFEVCNKSLCAALMMVYAFSPTIATGINLVLLLVAALMLRWISRRVRFYRTMVLDPVLAKFWTGFGTPRRPELIVFPKDDFGPFKAKSRLRLVGHSDKGWQLTEANWWMPSKEHRLSPESLPTVRRGWVMHSVVVKDESGREVCMTFSRRFDQVQLSKLLQQLGISEADADEIAKEEMASQFA